MTAEVAVLNTGAVALAADSAVTVGNRKIYNSAIKLFALSKVSPVAAMVYGNATLINTPWETIIKVFRRDLGARTYANLEEYAIRLISFIESNHIFLSERACEEWVSIRVASYLGYCRGEVEKAIEQQLEESRSGISEGGVQTAFLSYFDVQVAELESLDGFDLNETSRRDATAWADAAADRHGRELFGNLYPTLEKSLKHLAFLLVSKMKFPAGTSGLVVAGFGEDEVFPSIVTHEIDGGVPGFLRRRRDTSRSPSISHDNTSVIVPFAQDDMMATFMEGVNPELLSFVERQIRSTLSAVPGAVLDGLGYGKRRALKVAPALQEACHKIAESVIAELEHHRFTRHIHPVLEMVSALPKNELAEMAEALVNLTAFKRRVTHSLETVGGPVDVCVISKGDGLVWVKRKHYFPPQANHLFFENYMRGVQ